MDTHVNVYHGYGHSNDLVVYGHVLKNVPVKPGQFSEQAFKNILYMLRLFFMKPVAAARVRLNWNSQMFETTTENDGFFKFEWQSAAHVPAGWHQLQVTHIDDRDNILATATGKVYVPHVTQYGFISDIDDTVLVSHSATIFKRLRELFLKSSTGRSSFPDVTEHYQLLAQTHTSVPNPFFYVSSSEWNLYDYLLDFFQHNHLPDGSFLLSPLKRWFQFFQTGKTNHEGKLMRIMRIIRAFPKQQFVLLGDNSQRDPAIYAAIANKYPGRIYAVYLRNIKKDNEAATIAIIDSLRQNAVHGCLFTTNVEAIAHSKKIGLII